jgi:hypothetical protein
MNDLMIKEKKILPEKIEDLNKFSLLNTERLKILCQQLKSIEKLDLAIEIKKQKQEEIKNISILVIEAELRIGQIIDQLLIKKNKSIEEALTLKKLGITKTQRDKYTILMKYKDKIEPCIKKLCDENRAITPLNVSKEIKSLVYSKKDYNYNFYKIASEDDYDSAFRFVISFLRKHIPENDSQIKKNILIGIKAIESLLK